MCQLRTVDHGAFYGPNVVDQRTKTANSDAQTLDLRYALMYWRWTSPMTFGKLLHYAAAVLEERCAC